MRITHVLAVTVAAALTVGGIATAGVSGPKATGGVGWENAPQNFTADASFTAQPRKKGGGAKGHVSLEVQGDRNFAYEGVVTCYEQDGNYATFAGRITEKSGPDTNNRDFFQFWVLDGGEGSDSAGDRIQTNREGSLPDCSTDNNPPVQEVTEGNVQVHPDE